MMLLALAVGLLLPTPAMAQLSGHNLRGDYGVSSGSQPPPGSYLSFLYFLYRTDTVRNRDGDRLLPASGRETNLNVQAVALIYSWVSDKKILGGNYSFVVVPAWLTNALEAPFLGLDRKTDIGFGDLYLQPVNLGWHTGRADFMAGLGLFAPTGRYEEGARDNIGFGMWSVELFGGSTVYLDEARSLHFATTAFWETHSDKEDSDTHVGDLLTLEGGLGKSFLHGAASVGAAYFAQWKLTDDTFGAGLPGRLSLGKHRVFGIGPDVTLPIAKGTTLIALVNIRYLFDFGSRTTAEGDSLVVTATFPF